MLCRIVTAAVIAGPLMWLGAGLLLWAAWSAAIGGETVTAFTASIGSYHFDRGKKRCEINPGFGIEHGTPDLRFGVGGYHNSECEPSWYIGGAGTWEIAWGWRAGGGAVLLVGYDKELKGEQGRREKQDRALVVPMALIGREGKRYGFDIGYIPPEGNLIFLRLKILERVRQ